MQILRTRGTAYPTWGGYLMCITHIHDLPPLVFRHSLNTYTSYLTYIAGYTTPRPKLFKDMPVGMSADACIQYWYDL